MSWGFDMKSGFSVFWVLLVLGSMQGPVIKSMDNQISFHQLPDDVLLNILSFVTAQDPNAVGSLLKIQSISKRWKNLLTDQQIKWITDLTQENLHENAVEAVKNMDAKKLRLWIRFGLKATPEEIASTIEEIFKNVVTKLQDSQEKGKQLSMEYAEDNVLEMTKLLFELGGAEVRNHIYSITPLVKLGWKKILKYAFEQKIRVDDRTWHLVLEENNIDTVKLFLAAGIDPNVLLDLDEDPNVSSFSKPLPLLYYVKSAQMARILLDGGAKLYVDCKRSSMVYEIVRKAKELKDPSLVITLLKSNYPLEAATAIALALMTGASLAGMVCNIL